MSKLIINTYEEKSQINRNIYGHFSEHLGRCIYGGLFVGEQSDIPQVNGMRKDVVDALKEIRIPVLRWPGGCFADEYHWKDGIGPKADRKKMINTHWGGVVEDNSFGTHEFMELCAQLGCEPYINGNLGSGTVQEMSEWIEYLTFNGVSPMAELRGANGRAEPWRVKYFGVGNENWGCGGNMRPEYYADLYRRYQTYLRNYGENEIFKIACGPNSDDYHWTETLMQNAADYMDALTLHHYTLPGDWQCKGSSTRFDHAEYYQTLSKALKMDELITRHTQIMNRYDPNNRIGLIVDEWGCWYDVEPGTNPGFLYQQNTMRDAIVAALTLNIFNQRSDRVIMANLAQTVNVLQAVILTEGAAMVTTPTYHVFDLYKDHQDSISLSTYIEENPISCGLATIPTLSCSASRSADGSVLITVANLSATDDCPIECTLEGMTVRSAQGRIMKGKINAHNTFDSPENVKPEVFHTIGFGGQYLRFTMPACSVAAIKAID